MFAYFNNNIEIVEFTDGKIKIFDRGNDKEFLPKLSNWLKTTTGKVWDIELMEQSQHQQTNSEHVKEEIQSDPMVASAMNLFDDAEIVNVSDK